MFNSILVVCTGNICRSPLAERILRKYLPGKRLIPQELMHWLVILRIQVQNILLNSIICL